MCRIEKVPELCIIGLLLQKWLLSHFLNYPETFIAEPKKVYRGSGLLFLVPHGSLTHIMCVETVCCYQTALWLKAESKNITPKSKQCSARGGLLLRT